MLSAVVVFVLLAMAVPWAVAVLSAMRCCPPATLVAVAAARRSSRVVAYVA